MNRLEIADDIDFTVVDATISLSGSAPHRGNQLFTDVIISSGNALVTDLVLAQMMQKKKLITYNIDFKLIGDFPKKKFIIPKKNIFLNNDLTNRIWYKLKGKKESLQRLRYHPIYEMEFEKLLK